MQGKLWFTEKPHAVQYERAIQSEFREIHSRPTRNEREIQDTYRDTFMRTHTSPKNRNYEGLAFHAF